MNKGIFRITLLLLAAFAFVAHAAVVHHHHEGAICFAVSSDACAGHCHGHGKDTCDDECSAKALFTTPQQLSQTAHDTDDVTVDLPVWATIAVCSTDIATALIRSCAEFNDTSRPPVLSGYRSSTSLRAPPVVS